MDVVLIDWEPQARTRKHDHGKSFGLIFHTGGKLFEVRKGKLIISKAPWLLLEFPDIAHIAGNMSAEKKARSLHIYIPQLNMNFFDDTSEDLEILEKVSTK